MALTKLDTEHFSDVELAAETIANNVENLKTLMSKSKTLAMQNWIGDGRNEFSNLCYAVEQQMKDISDEFWSIYDALVEAEGVFLTADQELATAISSGEISESSSTSKPSADSGSIGDVATTASGFAASVDGAFNAVASSLGAAAAGGKE